MHSAITFISANRQVFINTEYIQAVLEDPSDFNKSLIILSNGMQYKVNVSVNVVIGKIKEVVEASNYNDSFECRTLNYNTTESS